MATDAEALLRRMAPLVVEAASWEHLDAAPEFDPTWDTAPPESGAHLPAPLISETSAVAASESALSAAEALSELNMFTELFEGSARTTARSIDSAGETSLALSGVAGAGTNPFFGGGRGALAGPALRASGPPPGRGGPAPAPPSGA